MKEKLLHKAMALQQESEDAEKNLSFVEEQIRELEDFEKSLKYIENNKEKKILASIGKGVFAKSELKNDKLLVEVGLGVLVKKSAGSVREVIDKQIKKFVEARIQIIGQLEEYKEELNKMISKIENLKK